MFIKFKNECLIHWLIFEGEIFATKADIKKTKILSQSEWNRIQGQLNKRAAEEERARQEREKLEQLHKMSMNKVKTWSNTVLVSNLARQTILVRDLIWLNTVY